MLNGLVPHLVVVLALAIGILGVLVLILLLFLICLIVSFNLKRSYVMAHRLMPPDDWVCIGLGAHTFST